MPYWTLLTENVKWMRLMMLLTLLLTLPMVTACVSLPKPMPSYPTNMEVMELSDGGVCLSPDSAKRLAEFIAELEKM